MANVYNAKRALQALKASLVNNETSLDLAKFLVGYKELMKFFDHLGKVFGFVVHDINDKFTKIEKTMAKDFPNNNYATIHSAIEYEKSTGIYKKEKKVTLSLLRLMRGLDFLRKFIEAIYNNQKTSKKSHELAWEVYEQTLAFRHNPVVRNLVKTGVHFLPKKQELYVKLSYGAEETNFDELFKDFSSSLEKIYFILYKLYEENNFLELVLA